MAARDTDGRAARFAIAPARSASDLAAAVALFRAYADALPVDLSYQDFAAELAGLPGKYAPPAGELLLARDFRAGALGCVALRPLPAAGACEMKRLYVAPHGRGLGLGRALVGAIVACAKRGGYREIRLDTLPSMAEAIPLYAKAGFVRIDPYYDTPVAGTLFFAQSLE